ncbi:MAG: hypothetical protein IJ104_03810, partial [Methanobrevibacter sp.]|nr:hypothetical protein [Methanobrevibacter sp.]
MPYNWLNVNIRYNIFMNNNNIFIYGKDTIYDTGYVVGNYWGTNSTSEINNIIPKANMDIIYSPGSHSFLTISGNSTFSEDNIQDYEIYFSGNYANMLPTFNTTISYTSTYSTINATSIGINGVPTTVRVSPKTYGVERLIINPDLYVLDINITKSLNNNYNVIVDAPETEYNYPLIITVNVTDKSNNIINTTADISINGTTHTINITNGIGTLEVNSLDIGTYDITTKIISNMDNYRNTTIYSTVDIIKSSSIITLACNNTTAIAREYIPFNIIAKDSKGNPVSMTVYIEEDGVKVGNVTTDENGDAIFRYKAEAGTHTYVVKVYEDKYWKSSKSNSVDIDVLSKIPAILTISSDVDYIVEENHDATIKVKLTDDKNVPIKRVEIKLFANEILVGNIFTDDNGECEFIFSNTSNIYNIKAVYDGNLTYYDNSSEINLIIAYGSSFFDLSFLINNTPENGVLNIIKNFTFDERFDKDFVNGIPINKNIVINGGNFTIDALNKSRIFNISAKNVTLDKLNIINGYAFVGGAILFSGESLTVVSSNFTNNNINMSKELQTFEELDYTGGGAIFSYGNINIINSSFKNNTLTLYSDIINKNVRYIGGGAVYTKNDLYVSNSIFDSNGVNLIKISQNAPSFTLQGSNVFSTGIFTNIVNSTFKNGFSNAPIYGTVSHFNYNGFFSMNFTSFYNNYAMYCGAVNLFVVDAFISNSTFDNNTAVYGLISCTSQNALITDSFITNNVVYSHGIFLSPTSNQFNVERSVIVNNKGNDTIIFEYGGDVPVNLIHNVFANNTGNTSYLISYLKYGTDRSNFNYNYWGNNTPYDSDIFNNVDNNLDYITLEIVGDNVTYTTIPTKYVIKFNGTENDQLPNFETLLEIISMFNVTVDKSSVVINGTGASVVL